MSQKIDPIEVRLNLAHDCIRAYVYADHIESVRPESMAWLSICDTLNEHAVKSWNSLFGTTSQETHWKSFTKDLVMPPGANLEPFGSDAIVSHLKTTHEKWASFHRSMVYFRNKRVAHLDPSVDLKNYPDLTWAMQSAYLYREWLLSYLRARKRAGEAIEVTDITGPKMLELFRKQISDICKA